MERWLASRVVFEGAQFSVKEIDVELAPGKVAHWEIVDKGGHSIAVVPVDAARDVYLVEEYFGAIDARGLSLPKGMVDPGESAEAAALREMREEIGMAGNLRKLSEMTISPGYLTQKTTVFLATGLHPAPLPGDEEGRLEVVKLPLDSAIGKTLSGEITEARTIAGLVLARAVLDERGQTD